MKLRNLYKKAIKTGIEHDPRGKQGQTRRVVAQDLVAGRSVSGEPIEPLHHVAEHPRDRGAIRVQHE